MKYPNVNIDKSEGWENRPTGIIHTKEDGTLEYKSLNEWQLCPKCNGTGLVLCNQGWPFSQTIISTAPQQCDVCNGKKIISKINGLPPQ